MTVTNKNNESAAIEETVAHATLSSSYEIEAQIKKIILEKLGLEEAKVEPAASFTDDLGIDSLDVFELMIAVENVFHISIPSEEAEKLTTPGKLVDYVKSVMKIE